MNLLGGQHRWTADPFVPDVVPGEIEEPGGVCGGGGRERKAGRVSYGQALSPHYAA